MKVISPKFIQFYQLYLILVGFLLFSTTIVRAERTFLLPTDNPYRDGKVLATTWLQHQIDSVHKAGGGKLVVPKGIYLTGGLVLLSNVNLYLSEGTTLLGSTNPDDYAEQVPSYPNTMNPQSHKFLVYAENQERISITGKGTLDGQGDHPNFKFVSNSVTSRPFLIRFIGCKDVFVEGIKMRRAANWTQAYQHCDRVRINDIDVYCFTNRNNDGIDIDNSSNVLLENSTIHADDDAICLKSGSEDVCKNIIVRNCTVSSNCNAIKMGTASIGGFINVTIKDIKIVSPPEQSHIWIRKYGLAGIALEIVDGGKMGNITINQVEMENVMTPIFLRLGNRGKGVDKVMPIGSMENIMIKNIKATKLLRPVSSCLVGIPGAKIRNVTLKNIEIEVPGGIKQAELIDTVPENAKGYPENKMFGKLLPGSLFYFRHVENLTVNNIRAKYVLPDARPVLFFDDVNNGTLKGISANAPENGFLAKAMHSSNIVIAYPAVNPKSLLNTIDCKEVIIK